MRNVSAEEVIKICNNHNKLFQHMLFEKEGVGNHSWSKLVIVKLRKGNGKILKKDFWNRSLLSAMEICDFYEKSCSNF